MKELKDFRPGDVVNNNIMELEIIETYEHNGNNAVVFHRVDTKNYVVGKNCVFSENDFFGYNVTWSWGAYDFTNVEHAKNNARSFLGL